MPKNLADQLKKFRKAKEYSQNKYQRAIQKRLEFTSLNSELLKAKLSYTADREQHLAKVFAIATKDAYQRQRIIECWHRVLPAVWQALEISLSDLDAADNNAPLNYERLYNATVLPLISKPAKTPASLALAYQKSFAESPWKAKFQETEQETDSKVLPLFKAVIAKFAYQQTPQNILERSEYYLNAWAKFLKLEVQQDDFDLDESIQPIEQIIEKFKTFKLDGMTVSNVSIISQSRRKSGIKALLASDEWAQRVIQCQLTKEEQNLASRLLFTLSKQLVAPKFCIDFSMQPQALIEQTLNLLADGLLKLRSNYNEADLERDIATFSSYMMDVNQNKTMSMAEKAEHIAEQAKAFAAHLKQNNTPAITIDLLSSNLLSSVQQFFAHDAKKTTKNHAAHSVEEAKPLFAVPEGGFLVGEHFSAAMQPQVNEADGVVIMTQFDSSHEAVDESVMLFAMPADVPGFLPAHLNDPSINDIFFPIGDNIHWRGVHIEKPTPSDAPTTKIKINIFDSFGSGSAQHITPILRQLLSQCGLQPTDYQIVPIDTPTITTVQHDNYSCGYYVLAWMHYQVKTILENRKQTTQSAIPYLNEVVRAFTNKTSAKHSLEIRQALRQYSRQQYLTHHDEADALKLEQQAERNRGYSHLPVYSSREPNTPLLSPTMPRSHQRQDGYPQYLEEPTATHFGLDEFLGEPHTTCLLPPMPTFGQRQDGYPQDLDAPAATHFDRDEFFRGFNSDNNLTPSTRREPSPIEQTNKAEQFKQEFNQFIDTKLSATDKAIHTDLMAQIEELKQLLNTPVKQCNYQLLARMDEELHQLSVKSDALIDKIKDYSEIQNNPELLKQLLNYHQAEKLRVMTGLLEKHQDFAADHLTQEEALSTPEQQGQAAKLFEKIEQLNKEVTQQQRVIDGLAEQQESLVQIEQATAFGDSSFETTKADSSFSFTAASTNSPVIWKMPPSNGVQQAAAKKDDDKKTQSSSHKANSFFRDPNNPFDLLRNKTQMRSTYRLMK